jgi:hypothetical protein
VLGIRYLINNFCRVGLASVFGPRLSGDVVIVLVGVGIVVVVLLLLLLFC